MQSPLPEKTFFKSFLVAGLLLLSFSVRAVPISGIINSYASVSAIAGTNLTVSTTAGFVVGDKIMIIGTEGKDGGLSATMLIIGASPVVGFG